MIKFNKKFALILFFLVFFLFSYFRLKPIYLQTFPFTFDQGRDFLKVEEIIRDKNLTLLGPTTGAPGVYHGVWWYYMLAIPYIIFNGSPTGFAFFIFLTNIIAFYFFYRFLNKEFNFLTAFFFMLIASLSPYLITMSIFVISSTPELPLFLILLILTYRMFKKATIMYQILIFLNLGFILEQEIPPGLFLIPAYFITLVLTKQIKKFFVSKKYLLYSFVSFIIPSIPRILFEISHDFIQTKAAFNYILKTKSSENILLFKGVFIERLNTFWNFYKELFIGNNDLLAIISLIIFVIGLFFIYKKLILLHRRYLLFLIFVPTFIFLLTCLYRKELWSTYLEGLPLFFLTLLSICFYGLSKIKHHVLKNIPYLILLFLLILNFNEFYKSITDNKALPLEGIRSQTQKINYLYQQNGNNDFCLRIYTPPVIPHTYNYLLSYFEKSKKQKKPITSYIKDQCWYIIEKEQEGDLFQLRIVKWRKEHIPEKAKLLRSHTTEDGTKIELWQE